eukprot:4606632-Pleurochrysis_carterae.AAC.1
MFMKLNVQVCTIKSKWTAFRPQFESPSRYSDTTIGTIALTSSLLRVFRHALARLQVLAPVARGARTAATVSA